MDEVLQAKTTVLPKFQIGARVSVWWAGLRRDFKGSPLLGSWLAMRPPHELAKVDAYVFAGDRVPDTITQAYFRGDVSRTVNSMSPSASDRVAFTTDSGKKIMLPADCFNYVSTHV